jgi:hypothetical protein
MTSIKRNPGRLRATLVAGDIPITDEALATLNAGLSVIGHGYHIEQVISEAKTTAPQIREKLSRIGTALRCPQHGIPLLQPPASFASAGHSQ